LYLDPVTGTDAASPIGLELPAEVDTDDERVDLYSADVDGPARPLHLGVRLDVYVPDIQGHELPVGQIVVQTGLQGEPDRRGVQVKLFPQAQAAVHLLVEEEGHVEACPQVGLQGTPEPGMPLDAEGGGQVLGAADGGAG